MQEREIERWITVNGKHIPIRKGQSVEEALKEKQIAKNEVEATQKNGYKDALDYDEFIDKNLPALKEVYKQEGEEGIKQRWYDLRMSKEKEDLHEIPIEESVKKIREIPDRIHSGWFRSANSDYKPHIVANIMGNPGMLNAALNMAYYNYRYQFERFSELNQKWIPYEGVDQSKKLSFKEWLTTPQTLYRGHTGQKKVDSDLFDAYTPDRKIAEKFVGYEGKGKIETIQIRPIDTWGSYQTTAEQEFLVPASEIKKRTK